MKKKIISIAAVVILATGTTVWFWFKPGEIVNAPDITLNTISGQSLNLRSFTGKTLLVSFWATTCSICIQEMPHLIDLYNELNSQNFEVIGIAMYYDPPNRVVEFSEQKKIPYLIALDINGHAAKAFGNVEVTPTIFLIGPDGMIVQQQTGKININQLRVQIKQFLHPDPTTVS